MDGSMGPGESARVCDWQMVPKTRRELNPHKKEVSSDGLTGNSSMPEQPRQAAGEQDAAFRAVALTFGSYFY